MGNVAVSELMAPSDLELAESRPVGDDGIVILTYGAKKT
jgi:hypothetical protein